MQHQAINFILVSVFFFLYVKRLLNLPGSGRVITYTNLNSNLANNNRISN